MNETITNLKRVYDEIKDDIVKRLETFQNRKKLFIKKEFIFCLLTPQSEAKKCWDSVLNLENKGFPEGESKIIKCFNGVRFKKKKAHFIKINLKKFDEIFRKIKEEKDSFKLREFLVKEVKGLGWKEASHFLRNIGRGENLTILDRHILRCLKKYKVIKDIPYNLSKKKYIEIENNMRKFSKKVNVPLSHLDFLFWYLEKKEIFK